MKFLAGLLLALSVAGASAVPPPGPDGKYTLTAPGITAKFIPYAASITDLVIKDKRGIDRDIVLGHDQASYYPIDPNHSHYGAVPGRYANRIGNATFTVDGVTYHTQQNDGPNTLHSGTNGWGYRHWNTTAVSRDSITFSILDDGVSTGMPGRVKASVTYKLLKNKWEVTMTADSLDMRTPLLLTQHTYWNLDAFDNPNTDLIWDHHYYTPYSKSLLEPDPNMVPTGEITPIAKGTINDFWSKPKKLGADQSSPEWVGNCGTASGCAGYNNCWVVDPPKYLKNPIVASLASAWSGIKVDIRTDQVGMQLYTCHWMNGAIPIKKTQGKRGSATNGFVKSGGCLALEAQDWNDGINNPQWGRDQFYGPGRKYKWKATYEFSNNFDGKKLNGVRV